MSTSERRAPGASADYTRLNKELGLFDVYAISTGAMFSSGFFLLPGVAAAGTGPSVVLAYFLAGIFVIPAMLSMAELSTAMPKAGGAYYFLDRALGPMVGTVGGLGAWFGLVLKSAFALVGMGAYLALLADVPIKALALGFTLVFAVVNFLGAKETSGIQRVLVTTLVGILALFVLQGVVVLGTTSETLSGSFSPFLTSGFPGLMATVGLVFVSYAGLTRVASVAEEVRRPERNIPLGMTLALLTASLLYVAGVFILVALLDPATLGGDLTPIATAALSLFGWMPGSTGLILIVIAAVAAFASTGNAGVLSASRYPLAMARDRLVPGCLGRLTRFKTPGLGIVVTAGTMAGLILFLDVEGLAKLASAFTLLLFALLNVAVLVMRESGIEAYDPGFPSPLYPWVQVVGVVTPLWLIAEMGTLSLLFTAGLVAVSLVWYFGYARARVVRSGAIYHTLARLGRNRFNGLELELRALIKEQGLRPTDAFDELIAEAPFLDCRVPAPFKELVAVASGIISRRAGLDPEKLHAELARRTDAGLVPLSRTVALPHTRLEGICEPYVLLARCLVGVRGLALAPDGGRQIRAVLFVVSPRARPAQHLRLLGHIATHVSDRRFMESWLAANSEQQIKETLLRVEHSLSLRIGATPATRALAGVRIADASLPPDTLIALVRRDRQSLFPGGSTVLEEGDRITVIGNPQGIRRLARRFRPEGKPIQLGVLTVSPSGADGDLGHPDWDDRPLNEA